MEDTLNILLRPSVLVSCELVKLSNQRFSLLHKGRGSMLNHDIVSQGFSAHRIGTMIFKELLHYESIAFSPMITASFIIIVIIGYDCN
ncbi:protein of unknown function [Candidatus Nitrosocosmicus franklandus]|uniref:Uncharacterized protein n=1 Tax=Candidatus Nitrosocosmicus franklandianus TaxID=1798806 RepID=A0A484IBS2_9ARCH|nr:protein of unknown function [Candidatus Nitrosocosmicus franklandus]